MTYGIVFQSELDPRLAQRTLCPLFQTSAL